jgi:DNA polymerase-3 subunit delta'
MAFKDFPKQDQSVGLLQRSLERGRLGHAYLFTGSDTEQLVSVARVLARTLNCLNPIKASAGQAVDCCEECANCRKIEQETHADVHWVRPESKSRVITVPQMRELMREVQLKPAEAEFKVAIIVGAERMNVQGANAFLKTLEEPPPKSILILLSTEPQRLLETILSRCLRLEFGGEGSKKPDPAVVEWLTKFSDAASGERRSLLGRYNLLDVLAHRLSEVRTQVEETLTAKSPLERYDDVEKDLRERWEDELKAAIEGEYRRQRSELLLALQWWFRDVWMNTLWPGSQLLRFPELVGTAKLAKRLNPARALENLKVMESLHRLLHTNVQESLALEVGLLKLHL